ncbi:hypothetical protein Tco_0164794 [Tanacetum coccineum]
MVLLNLSLGRLEQDVLVIVSAPKLDKTEVGCHSHELVFEAFDKRHIGEDAIISPRDSEYKLFPRDPVNISTPSRLQMKQIKILIFLGCDPLALVDGFTPIEDNIGLLETRFDEEAVFVIVFPKDVTGSVNLTLLSLFFGVTATNLALELLMLGQLVPKCA